MICCIVHLQTNYYTFHWQQQKEKDGVQQKKKKDDVEPQVQVKKLYLRICQHGIRLLPMTVLP